MADRTAKEERRTENAEPRGVLTVRVSAMPADTNPNGDIFGGWIMSQMDLGSGILASKMAKTRLVTVAVDGMSFLQPVRVGHTVAVYARAAKGGPTPLAGAGDQTQLGVGEVESERQRAGRPCQLK